MSPGDPRAHPVNRPRVEFTGTDLFIYVYMYTSATGRILLQGLSRNLKAVFSIASSHSRQQLQGNNWCLSHSRITDSVESRTTLVALHDIKDGTGTQSKSRCIDVNSVKEDVESRNSITNPVHVDRCW